MKRELEDEIRAVYPELYEECGSFTCGNGWHPILLEFTKEIKALQVENTQVLQVKEKFGGLRIYTHVHPENVRNLVRKAEEEAFKTCEWCGSKEDVTTEAITYWIRTLCGHCKTKVENGWRQWTD